MTSRLQGETSVAQFIADDLEKRNPLAGLTRAP